jgi:hypothetical protein
MNSEVHKTGWISVGVSEANQNKAKAIRAERDRKYGNIFTEMRTDERWVGDLGEMVFDNWFKHNGVEGYQWILEGTAGAPDFVTALNIRIGVKTVKRAVPPRADYTAQITAQHAHEPIEQFFFMSYEIDKKKMWLLGGLDKETFLKEATNYKAGDQVHAKYTIREGHEIYNIEIAKLVQPNDWIKNLSVNKN